MSLSKIFSNKENTASSPKAAIPATIDASSDCDIISCGSSPLKMSQKLMHYTALANLKRLGVPQTDSDNIYVEQPLTIVKKFNRSIPYQRDLSKENNKSYVNSSKGSISKREA